MQPHNPNKNIIPFLAIFQLYFPDSCQLEAVSITAGAIRHSVDSMAAPSSAAHRSSHGTVAASANGTRFIITLAK